MTSHTGVLFDLPTQRDGEENKLRDEAHQSVLRLVKGRFWCYFMELKTWAPVTASVRVDPVTLDIKTQGAVIKDTITKEMSYYFNATLKILSHPE